MWNLCNRHDCRPEAHSTTIYGRKFVVAAVLVVVVVVLVAISMVTGYFPCLSQCGGPKTAQVISVGLYFPISC